MFNFHHIALSVADLRRSITFYQQLEFAPVMHWQAEDDSLQIAHLKKGDMLLELFCYRDPQQAPQSTQQLESDLKRIGTKHFGLRCANIREAKERLEEMGIAENIQITRGRTGIDYFFIRDPDDIFIEFVQDNRQF